MTADGAPRSGRFAGPSPQRHRHGGLLGTVGSGCAFPTAASESQRGPSGAAIYRRPLSAADAKLNTDGAGTESVLIGAGGQA